MRELLALPTSLLLVLGLPWHSVAKAAQWPYNLPPHQKYWPEHESLARRQIDIQDRLSREIPVGIRKMSGDPSEMFFFDYWQFESGDTVDRRLEGPTKDQLAQPDLQRRACPLDMPNNNSLSNALLPPYLRHSDNHIQTSLNLRNFPRDMLQRRDFKCPTGTTACTSINRLNNCCGTDETCTIIEDTGVGDVGCCPKGQTCGGSVSSCNIAEGYKSCPGSSNGGCCIPNFSCQDVGCVAGGNTTTTSVSIQTVTQISGSSTSSSPSTPRTFTDTAIVVAASASTSDSITNPSVVTVTTTISPSTKTDTVFAASASRDQGTLECSTGFQTCASSLGGGCCPTDRACGSGGVCPPLSTTAAAVAPVRPTDESNIVTTTSTALSMCPTGYYMCSAYYIPGCCQVGRNCDTTNCPSSTTETVVSSGATIIVPGGAGGAVPTESTADTVSAQQATTTTAPPPLANAAAGPGTCATGWSACAGDQGGGCCPSGYACGASCSATAGGGPGTVAKAQPQSQAVRVRDRLGIAMIVIAATLGIGMVVL